MLSVFDLLAAKTIDLDLSAYLTMCWYLTRTVIKKIEPKLNNYMAEPGYVSACRDFLKKLLPERVP
jgi:hypothetical protein